MSLTLTLQAHVATSRERGRRNQPATEQEHREEIVKVIH